MPIISYVIKSFRGGNSDEDSVGIKGSFKFGRCLNIHKRRDSLTCGQAMSKISAATVTDLINFFVSGVNGTTYAFGNSGKIYSISDEGGVNLRYTDANGAVKGAGYWGLNDATRYLWWATDTSISRKPIPDEASSAAWGDVTLNWTTTLTSADWHTMKRACGALLMCNKQYLALLDYTGSFTPQAMNIEPGNSTKCLESRDDYAIIGSTCDSEDEEGYIWSWITTALNYVNKKKIPVKGINALIETEYKLLQGGSDGELFLSDFTNTEPLIAIPDTLGSVNPGGVAIDNDLALFGFYGGSYPGLWSFGRRARNRPVVLNYEYRLASEVTGSTISNIGAVGSNKGIVYASWQTTDGSTLEYGIDQVSSTTKAVAIYDSLEFDANTPHLKKYFDRVKIVMSPLPAGCSIGLEHKIDKASSWTTAKTGSGGTTFTTANSTEAFFLINKEGKILELQLTLTPTGNTSPEVLGVITYLNQETKDT